MNDKEIMTAYNSIELSADKIGEMEAELMKKFDTQNDTENGYVNGGRAYKLQLSQKKISLWKIAVGIGSAAAVVGLCVFGLSRLDLGTVSPIVPADTQSDSSALASDEYPALTTTVIIDDTPDEPEIVQPAEGEISVSMLFDSTDYGFGWDFSIFEEHFAGLWTDDSGKATIVGYNTDIFDYTGDNSCGGFAENEDGWYMLQSFADGKYCIYAVLKADNSMNIRRYDLESDTQSVSLKTPNEVYFIYSDDAAITELGDDYAGEATLLTLTRLMREHTSQYGESDLGEVLGKIVYAPDYRFEDAMENPHKYSIDGVDYARYTVNGDSGKVWVNSLCEKGANVSVRCYTMDYIEHLRNGLSDESYNGIRAKYIELWLGLSDNGNWQINGYDLWENDVTGCGIVSKINTPLSEKVKDNDSNKSLTSDIRTYGDVDTAQYVLRAMLTENTVNVQDAADGFFGSEYYTNGVTEIYYYEPAYNEYYLLDVLVGADMVVIDGKAYVVGGLPDKNAELKDVSVAEVLYCYDGKERIGKTVLDCEPYYSRKLKAYDECLVATYWKALDAIDYKVFDRVTLSQLCETNYSPMDLNGTGGIEIPSLTEMPLEEAINMFNALGFEVTVLYEESNEIANGYVIRSTPEEHELALLGSEVVLVVSYAEPTY